MVKLLLETSKANVDSKDKDNRAPLLWAAKGGYETVVMLLLATGKVEVDSKDRYGRTPLSWAAAYGYEGVVKCYSRQARPISTRRVEAVTHRCRGPSGTSMRLWLTYCNLPFLHYKWFISAPSATYKASPTTLLTLCHPLYSSMSQTQFALHGKNCTGCNNAGADDNQTSTGSLD